MSEDIKCPKCGAFIKYWELKSCLFCKITILTQENERLKSGLDRAVSIINMWNQDGDITNIYEKARKVQTVRFIEQFKNYVKKTKGDECS